MLVNFVIVLTLLIGFCGLAIDVGMLELKKVQLQNAADAAVLGAVYEHGRGNTNWQSGGIADAGLNGFTNGVNNVTVTISNPPTSGSFSGNNNAVQAVVTQQVGTTFISSSSRLTAQAVSLLPQSSCLVYLLYNTLNISGSSSFKSACSVYIGSSITEDSSSSIQAANFDVISSAGSSTLSGSTQPLPQFNYPVQSDPLARITQPVFSACNFNVAYTQSVPRSISPGTYCNNSIECSNSTLTLQSGLYIITGGVDWNNCKVSGTGVTLFLTSGGGSNFESFQANNATVSLSAPTDTSQGAIPGILIFTDRAWSGSAQDVQWINSTYSGDGVWYSTNTGILISNCQSISGVNYLGFVVNNMSISGSKINAPYTNSPAALASSSSTSVGLAE